MSAPARDTLRGPACWPSLAVAATGMPGPLASVWAEGLGTVPGLGAPGRALGTVGVVVLRGSGPRSQGSPQSILLLPDGSASQQVFRGGWQIRFPGAPPGVFLQYRETSRSVSALRAVQGCAGEFSARHQEQVQSRPPGGTVGIHTRLWKADLSSVLRSLGTLETGPLHPAAQAWHLVCRGSM